MTNLNPQVLVLAVQTCGVTADSLLARASSFKVLAVFQRSVYLQACLPASTARRSATTPGFQPEIICLLDTALGKGPLHCCVENFAGVDLSQLKVGARIFNDRTAKQLRLTATTQLLYRDCLVPESTLQIPVCKDLAGALPDCKTNSLQALHPTTLVAAKTNHENSLWANTLDWLSVTLAGAGTGSGDAAINPDEHGGTNWYRLLSGCGEDIHFLTHYQTDSTDQSHQFEGIVEMLGAGVGLTPSGDDFICGVIASFYLMGEAGRLQQLQSVLVANMLSRTHPVSAAHLYEACSGNANDASMAVITALIDRLTTEKNNPAALAQACNAMGASSGWDFLAGLVAALYLRQSRSDSLTVCASSVMPFQTSPAGGRKASESEHRVV